MLDENSLNTLKFRTKENRKKNEACQKFSEFWHLYIDFFNKEYYNDSWIVLNWILITNI